MYDLWAIVLAAGASTRMKRQKLLLPYGEKTIIETVIENILPLYKSKIIVVLGSHYDEIKKQICKFPVTMVFNQQHTEGMLSSVICGFRALPEEAGAAVLYLGDQPQIPAEISYRVNETWARSGKGIIIPCYHARRGHPVLIETKYRRDIENLDPNLGLKQLMLSFPEDVLELDCSFPEILRDIDTPDEYDAEMKRKHAPNS